MQGLFILHMKVLLNVFPITLGKIYIYIFIIFLQFIIFFSFVTSFILLHTILTIKSVYYFSICTIICSSALWVKSVSLMLVIMKMSRCDYKDGDDNECVWQWYGYVDSFLWIVCVLTAQGSVGNLMRDETDEDDWCGLCSLSQLRLGVVVALVHRRMRVKQGHHSGGNDSGHRKTFIVPERLVCPIPKATWKLNV